MSSESKAKKFGDLVKFVVEKEKAAAALPENYISTENMLPNFGGVGRPSSVPSSGSVTIFRKDDILFSNIRTYFKKVWQAKYDGFCSNDVLVLRSADKTLLLQDFLHNICRSTDFIEYTVRTAKGAKMPRGDKDAINRFEFKLPEISEQKKICSILNVFDDRITLLRETNQTLEAIAQAIFKSWFVDFGPVRAKSQGVEPEGMDADTAALFPDRFVDSELGEIPIGWNPVRVSSLIELAYGKALKADQRRSGLVPVYGSGGITGWHDTALVNEASIVVGRKGTVGSIFWEHRPFYPIDTVFYVKTGKPLTYVYQLLLTLGLSEMNTDAAVPGLNRENVYRLLVPKAPLSIINAFDDIVSVVHKSIEKNIDQMSTLVDIRDTLLPRLISGQLQIPDTAQAIEKATA